jgi:AraC-like DNA-binding protein
MAGSFTAPWDYPRRVNSVRIMVAAGIDYGMRQEALLAGSGIDPATLNDPMAEVQASQELRVVRNLQQGCSHVSGLGLRIGMRYRATAYEELGYAMLSCASLREGIKCGLRFHMLAPHFVSLRFEDGNEASGLVYDASAIPADVRQFLLERDMASVHGAGPDMFCSSIPVVKVELNFPRPGYAALFEELYGRMPQFDSARNATLGLNRYLDLPPSQANPTTFKLCEALCKKREEQLRAQAGVSARVRARLLADEVVSADMECIAAEFGMTSRTLRRQLQVEGTSFRVVLDEVREVIADELFGAQQITVDEVAARLGFSEASSFISAFKRWKGVSPREAYRRRPAST